MNKRQFLNKLRGKLNGLSEEAINEHIAFFSEMIDDRTEEGLSEKEAIAAIGSLDLLIPEIMATNTENESEFKERKKMSTASIILLSVGAVVWAPLLISVIAVVFSLVASMWAIILSSWLGIFLSFALLSPAGIVTGIILSIIGHPMTGAFLIGLGLFLGGAAILVFYTTRYLTKVGVFVTGWTLRATARCITRIGR